MRLKTSISVALSFALAVTLPALAMGAGAPQSTGTADTGGQPVATLQGAGAMMVSRGGGPFASGTPSDPLFGGERVMVTSGTATVVYANGCRQTFSQPGVYAISANCARTPTTLAATHPDRVAVPAAKPSVTGGVVGSIVSESYEVTPSASTQ